MFTGVIMQMQSPCYVERMMAGQLMLIGDGLLKDGFLTHLGPAMIPMKDGCTKDLTQISPTTDKVMREGG